MSRERDRSSNPDEPCWFDTLLPVPESEKKKIDRIIAAALQALARDVAGVGVHLPKKSIQSPSLEELVKDKSKRHPTS